MRTFVLVVLAAAAAMAQTPDTAAIEGRVIDQNHDAVADAEVHVRGVCEDCAASAVPTNDQTQDKE